MSEEVPQTDNIVVEEAKPLDRTSAIQIIIGISHHHGGLLKGVAETCKAIEAGKAKAIFIAEDCDNDQAKTLVTTLAKQNQVPVLEVPSWEELKDFCKLGLLSSTIKEVAEQKGKPAKIKPRCSFATIIDWGEDSEARRFLESELK
jgi:small subunit ribosomal protein S12e